MTEREADIKCDSLVEAVYHVGFEAWALMAVIVPAPVEDQLKLAVIVYIHASVVLGLLV